MSRFIAIYTVLFTASVVFGQTETSYAPPMPFSPYADSYQYSIQKLYESLPEVKNTNNIPGTSTLVNAELQNILSGTITWEEEKNPNGRYWKGTNLLPIGKHKIEVRNLGTDYYFWCIYGKVQLFVQKNVLGIIPPPPTKIVRNYFLVIHFNKGNAKAYVDFLTIENALVTNDTQTLDRISKEATARLAKANKEAYDTVKSKSEWTIDKKPETGTFDSYRRGVVTLKKNDAKMSFPITRFSYNDQLLIRGFIDHQGISAR